MTHLTINDWVIPTTPAALEAGGLAILDGVTVSFGRENAIDAPAVSQMNATIRCETVTAAQSAHQISPGDYCTLTDRYQLAETAAIPRPARAAMAAPVLATDPDNLQTTWRLGTVTEADGTIWVEGDILLGPGNWNTGDPLEWRYLSERIEPGSTVQARFTSTPPAWDTEDASAWIDQVYYPNSYTTWLESLPEIPATHEAGKWVFDGKARINGYGYPVIYFSAPSPAWWQAPAAAWETQTLTWQEACMWKLTGDITIGATQAASQSVTVFQGRVTSLEIEGLGGQACLIHLAAADMAHSLNTAMIAAPRRAAESVLDRINWILDQATNPAAPHERPALLTQSDANPALNSVDIDNRSALELINEAARSAALTAWTIVGDSGDNAILLEDPDTRPAIAYITTNEAGVMVTEKAIANALLVDGSQIDMDGVQITRDGEITATQAKVSYPVEKIDPQTGQISYETKTALTGSIGPATLEIATWLKKPEEVTQIGAKWLRRAARADWKINGVKIKTARLKGPAPAGQLIDITNRIGQQIIIFNMPPWMPTGHKIERFCIEGGTLTAARGKWEIDLNLTRPGGAGYALKWNELPDGTFLQCPIPWGAFAALTTKENIKEGYADARNH